MGIAAAKMNIKRPSDTAVDTEEDLSLTGSDYSLQARLSVGLLGLGADAARVLKDAAHQNCPLFKGTSM